MSDIGGDQINIAKQVVYNIGDQGSKQGKNSFLRLLSLVGFLKCLHAGFEIESDALFPLQIVKIIFTMNNRYASAARLFLLFTNMIN